MQLSPEYYRKNAERARQLSWVAGFLDGNDGLALALRRRAIRWERKAKETEARHAQKS